MKLNSNIIKAQYAVRGRLARMATKLKNEGKPIISCNIGNPQALQ